MPKADWVARRSGRYEIVATPSTNQWSVSVVNGMEKSPGMDRAAREKLRPFLPT
jgi:hypothetical protein